MLILAGMLVGALGVGLAGFVIGASIPDERAGEAAITLAGIGALVGAALGALLAFVAGRLIG